MILDHRRHRWILMTVASALLIASAGCRGAGSKKQVVAAEPSLSGAIDNGDAVVVTPDAAPAKTVSYADRHPLLSKPREYWDNSGDNKIVKGAAATFIGVPAGFFGEMKQIVVGKPPEPSY